MNPDNDFSGRRRFDLGVKLLNFVVWLLYGEKITDEATCYKVCQTALLHTMSLTCERFEFCPEFTAKAIRLGMRIRDVPIGYSARDEKSGKQIRPSDAIAALWTLWSYWTWKRPCFVSAQEVSR